eukprot:2122572-Amphidinium_carterae.1
MLDSNMHQPSSDQKAMHSKSQPSIRKRPENSTQSLCRVRALPQIALRPHSPLVKVSMLIMASCSVSTLHTWHLEKAFLPQ